MRVDRLPGREPRRPEPVHPGLVDMAAHAVPRTVAAHDGQRHRAHLPDRVPDVIYLQRRARTLLSRHVRRHEHAQRDEELGHHPRDLHALPKEQRVEPAEQGRRCTAHSTPQVKAMVDGNWKRCFGTLRVVEEEDVNPVASGMAAGSGLVGFGISGVVLSGLGARNDLLWNIMITFGCPGGGDELAFGGLG